MLNLLLLVSLLVGHPPRINTFPWQLMVGTETPNGIAWEQTDQSFLEPEDCVAAAKQLEIAECVEAPHYA
jgi:hypothetical protein